MQKINNCRVCLRIYKPLFNLQIHISANSLIYDILGTGENDHPLPSYACDVITNRGKCFYLASISGSNRDRARELCKIWEGDLASVLSEKENDLLSELLTDTDNDKCWIGLYSLTKGTLNWVNESHDTTYAESKSNSSGPCYYITNNTDMNWESIDCNSKNSIYCYICSKQGKSREKMYVVLLDVILLYQNTHYFSLL